MDNLDFLDSEVGEKLTKMLKSIADNQEQIDSNKFVGKVMDNNDPSKNGRCRVFIYGVHPKELMSDVEELPWVTPMSLSTYMNSFSVPGNSELVNIEFEGGDINYPKYTTKLHTKSSISKVARNDYPNTVVLFEYGDYSFVLNRTSGEMKIKLAGNVEIAVDKDGAITLDNHLAIAGADLLKMVAPPGVDDVTLEILAETQSKLALGKPITVRTSGDLKLESPNIILGGGKSQVGSVVEPNINPLQTGGFNCLSNCLFAGVPHSGSSIKSYYSSAFLAVEEAFSKVSDIDN